jgi:alkylation response protein AidB-like acyl-CoA dehydrogenase
MEFSLSEEHKMIRDVAREFAQKELKPGVIDRDSKQDYPTEQVARMSELGFMGINTLSQYGGSEMDALSYAIIVEELSKIDNSSSVIWNSGIWNRRTKK